MARKKKEDVQENQIDINKLVNGCFVYAMRWKNYECIYQAWIKLSEIKSVQNFDYYSDLKECCKFYTYKDCCYILPFDESVLLKLINDFVYRKQEE